MADDVEVIFVTASWCPHCRRLKEAWKPLFEQGIIRDVDVESPEGQRLIKGLDINYVPTCLVKTGDKVKFCEDKTL